MFSDESDREACGWDASNYSLHLACYEMGVPCPRSRTRVAENSLTWCVASSPNNLQFRGRVSGGGGDLLKHVSVKGSYKRASIQLKLCLSSDALGMLRGCFRLLLWL